MTQPPERPPEQEPPAGATAPFLPPDPTTPPPPPPPYQPYAAAPPITEAAYGAPGTPVPPGGRAIYAPRWRRLIAFLLDGAILGVVSTLVSAFLVGSGAMFDNDPDQLGKRLAADSITAVLGLVYYVWQHGKWGRTVGKRAMDIRVVRSDDGGAISYGTAAWRLIFTYLLLIITLGFGWLVDSAWVLWDGRRQALHDKVARTVVVMPELAAPDPYAHR